MTTLVKSQLNPLADAFVPANCLNGLKNSRIVKVIKAKKTFKTSLQTSGKQDSNDRDYKRNFFSMYSFYKITSIITDSKIPSIDQTYMLESLSFPRLPQKSFVEKNSCIFQNSHLPKLEYSNDYDQAVVYKPNKTSKNETPIEENECICPPMFGWVVPPDFLGNPFNFKYECSKKHPHSPFSDTDINRWTLDQCYSGMWDILKDVVDSITVDSDFTREWDEENEVLKEKHEMCATEIEDAESNEMERDETESSGLDPTSKVSKIFYVVSKKLN